MLCVAPHVADDRVGARGLGHAQERSAGGQALGVEELVGRLRPERMAGPREHLSDLRSRELDDELLVSLQRLRREVRGEEPPAGLRAVRIDEHELRVEVLGRTHEHVARDAAEHGLVLLADPLVELRVFARLPVEARRGGHEGVHPHAAGGRAEERLFELPVREEEARHDDGVPCIVDAARDPVRGVAFAARREHLGRDRLGHGRGLGSVGRHPRDAERVARVVDGRGLGAGKAVVVHDD